MASSFQSTIVEIIRAYQPILSLVRIEKIYNSRNYQSLLADPSSVRRILNLQQQKLLEPTSQPNIKIIKLYLQQQKLLEPTSHQNNYLVSDESTIVEIIRAYQPVKVWRVEFSISTIVEIIRAYQPIDETPKQVPISTIVEIIRAYQPTHSEDETYRSTIVEIIRAYQPSLVKPTFVLYLQQQKLLEPTSTHTHTQIYNSRNYQSLLANSIQIKIKHKSTIVEIIRAYQPLRLIYRGFLLSTIVEIIRAYQPLIDCKDTKNPLNKSIFCIFFKEEFPPLSQNTNSKFQRTHYSSSSYIHKF